jgi:tRNA threonylcarbamoyladenosine biosynthesis protein TsaB
LRIGISTLKGLAWPLGKKAVGVSTLAALSMNVPFSTRLVCPVLDARKGEVYTALYDTSEGFPKAVMEDSAMAPEALFAEITRRGLSASVIFLGGGLEVYSKKIVEALPAAMLAPEHSMVRASAVGRLAFESRDSAVDPAGLTPVYLRRSEAEIKFG